MAAVRCAVTDRLCRCAQRSAFIASLSSSAKGRFTSSNPCAVNAHITCSQTAGSSLLSVHQATMSLLSVFDLG